VNAAELVFGRWGSRRSRSVPIPLSECASGAFDWRPICHGRRHAIPRRDPASPPIPVLYVRHRLNLTGSPGIDRAHDWAVQTLEGWGTEAYNEQYGT